VKALPTSASNIITFSDMPPQAGSPLGILPLISNSKVAETLYYSSKPHTNYRGTLHSISEEQIHQLKSGQIK
jgi:hypothetical protein